MKRILYPILFACVFASCSKNDIVATPPPTPPLTPPPQVRVDTAFMASGWTKVKVTGDGLVDIAWADSNHLVVSTELLKLFLTSDRGANWQPYSLFHNAYNIDATSNGTLHWANKSDYLMR